MSREPFTCKGIAHDQASITPPQIFHGWPDGWTHVPVRWTCSSIGRKPRARAIETLRVWARARATEQQDRKQFTAARFHVTTTMAMSRSFNLIGCVLNRKWCPPAALLARWSGIMDVGPISTPRFHQDRWYYRLASSFRCPLGYRLTLVAVNGEPRFSKVDLNQKKRRLLIYG